MSDFRGSKTCDEVLNQLMELPERDIPKELRGLVADLRLKLNTCSPEKKRGRPKDLASKFHIVFLYAWFTLNVPDSGAFRVKGYRRELDGWILDHLDISENQLNRNKTIWNKFVKSDLEDYLSILHVHLDDLDPIGSRITTIEGLRAMQYEGALALFPIWVNAAISKYA